MSIFGRIKSAIFGEAQAAEAAAPAQTSTAPATSAPTAPTPAPASGASSTAAASPAPTTNPAPPPAKPAAAQTQPVDIEQMLNAAVKKSGQKLDWRHSIVDLMKALGMDASLAERKELAGELGYGGDTGDSAKMNTFLHKALMKKLAENGGKVPADLLD
jgi:Domain of unknown function (DUF3597)